MCMSRVALLPPANLVSVFQGLRSNQAAPAPHAIEFASNVLPVPGQPYSSTLLMCGILHWQHHRPCVWLQRLSNSTQSLPLNMNKSLILRDSSTLCFQAAPWI